MGIPESPDVGDRHINATALDTIRYQSEHLNTFTKLRDGFQKAVANIALLTPEQGKAAGISKDDVAEIVELAEEYKKILGFYEASADMTEVLHHTRLDRGHKIATRLAETTEQARRRAERSPNGAEILGSLADLIEYQLGPAQKSALTKAKAKAGQDKEKEKGSDPVKPDVNVTP